MHLDLDNEIERLLISPIELEQALVNLIRNGIEACPAEAIVVVRTLSCPGQVRIEVTDGGRGLSKEDCQQVFEPFYTTRLDVGGSGLGLSFVKRIVEDHWGTVSARPVLDGIGTVFSIELPVGGPPREIHVS